MKRLKPFLPALCIFSLAILVRLIYNLTVARNYYPLYDSVQYQTIAFNILDEHCFCLHPYITTAYRAPLWPWLIAGISLLVGRWDFYDRLFLCFVGAGTCTFIYLFARDLFSKRLGFVAGMMACVYPALYIYDGWMYTESLFTFLLTAVCYTVYRIQCVRGQSKRLWLICGALLGLLSLARPNGIIVIALVGIWAIFMTWLRLIDARSLRNVLLTVLLACALIAPWTVRNYLVSQSLIPVATGDGTVLLGAYNDQMLNSSNDKGSWINPLRTSPLLLQPFPLYTCNAVCEVQREDVSKSSALQWIHANLSSMPAMLLYHFINFWTPNTREADMPMYRFSNQLSSQIQIRLADILPIPIFILAALGLVTTLKKRWRELLFPVTILLLTLGEALAYYGSSRFRAPAEPILLLLAAGGLWWLTRREPGSLRWLVMQRRKQRNSDEKQHKRESQL